MESYLRNVTLDSSHQLRACEEHTLTISEAEPALRGGKPKRRAAPRSGTGVIWPKGLEERWGISAPTRWRWEQIGRIPPRDIDIGGKTGWRPATIDKAESRPAA